MRVPRPSTKHLGVALVLAVALSAGAGSTAGAPETPQARKIQLGIVGDPGRFAGQTGQRSALRHNFVGWHQGNAWPKILANLRPIPMVALKTGGTITPLAIAQGQGDAFLLQLNGALADFGSLVYVRPLPEMNGHWNDYCAFSKDGSSRGPRFSTAAFRKAFARSAIIARGGPARQVNAKLRKLGLPGIGETDLPVTKARIVWNPQGYGAPDVPGNSAKAYYPGDAYVDVVANDLYRQASGVAWDANEALYAAFKHKPYGIAEWGLWGIDDPSFVEKMGAFARSHQRVELLAWFNSKAGSIFDLGSKPRSRAAYRKHITPLGR
jgi:hypothetical protein